MITCWISLDDLPADAGPIEYVRGSHRWPRSAAASARSSTRPRTGSRRPGARRPDGVELDVVPVVVKAGGGSFHHGLTWHGSPPNTNAAVARMALVRTCSRSRRASTTTNVDLIYSRYRRHGDLRSTSRSSRCCGTRAGTARRGSPVSGSDLDRTVSAATVQTGQPRGGSSRPRGGAFRRSRGSARRGRSSSATAARGSARAPRAASSRVTSRHAHRRRARRCRPCARPPVEHLDLADAARPAPSCTTLAAAARPRPSPRRRGRASRPARRAHQRCRPSRRCARRRRARSAASSSSRQRREDVRVARRRARSGRRGRAAARPRRSGRTRRGRGTASGRRPSSERTTRATRCASAPSTSGVSWTISNARLRRVARSAREPVGERRSGAPRAR